MSSTSEPEQTTVESSAPTETTTNTAPPSSVPTEEKAVVPAADAAADASTAPVVEEQNSVSSWFNNFTLPPNLSNQLTTLSSSLLQVTSKVTAAANTLVQKTLPQRPSTPTESEPTDEKSQPSSEEQKETTETNKDLTSMLTDFSSTVMKGAQQLKHAVEEKSLLGNFTKEHEKFLTEKRTLQRREEAAVPPWVGYVEEEEMKKQILALSKEKRNFLRTPPPGANYHFDMAAAYPVALATLEIDENLKQMRFDLVPKQITEEAFWCNYFYRVSLIKQSTQLSALAQENANSPSINEARAAAKQRNRTASDSQEKQQDANQEFVSEDYDTSAVNMDDIRREIEQLTVPKKSGNKSDPAKAGSPDESEWDKSLADELDNVSAEELEAQINQMLEGDTK